MEQNEIKSNPITLASTALNSAFEAVTDLKSRSFFESDTEVEVMDNQVGDKVEAHLSAECVYIFFNLCLMLIYLLCFRNSVVIVN